MLKKLCIILAIAVVFSSFGITAFASGENDKYSKNAKSTDQFLVTITRPQGNETTYQTSYVICGNTDKEEVVVELLMFNEASDKYEAFKNTDSESEWTIGGSGFFTKEVLLPKGANQVRIVAHKKSELDKLQLNNFTITVLDKEGIREVISGVKKVTDILRDKFFKQ